MSLCLCAVDPDVPGSAHRQAPARSYLAHLIWCHRSGDESVRVRLILQVFIEEWFSTFLTLTF